MPRVLLTGANRGLGYATAAKLLAHGCDVVVTARTPAAAEAAATALRATGAPGRVRAHPLDVSQRSSIEALAGALLDEGEPFDVLINNAARMNRGPPVIDRGLVDAGAELFYATNALGPLLLTRRLLPLVAPVGRVVNVASRTHLRLPQGSFDFADVDGRARFDPRTAYARSKLVVTWLTWELARRLRARGADITANCVCPGFVPTTAGQNVGGWLRFVTLRIMPFMPFAHTVDEATDTFVMAALDPGLAGVSGRFFAEKHEIAASADSRDEAQSRHMWSVACAALGLPEELVELDGAGAARGARAVSPNRHEGVPS